MATPDFGGGSQEGGRGPEARGLRPLSLRVFLPTPGLWKMAAHPTAGPSTDSTHPHPLNSSTSTFPFLASDGCLLWNIWFCSNGLNSWWFKKKNFKRSLLPLGKKKIHLRPVKQSFLLGEKGSLPTTTFHTGGVAFDLKRLWQFTSELLFIYPKHWAC